MVSSRCALIVVGSALAIAQNPAPQSDPLDLSVQQLMQLEVTSVARKQQTLARAAAAVYVITREEIRRSAYRTVPELLRLAPGIYVGQAGAHTWAITARGFNGTFANKMLVLVDGRSVYTPQYAGVYWELHDLMVEDIERIEVIRGPGATMWGANAVNGVINIITRSAKATQGGMLAAGGGISEGTLGALRYGGQIGSKAWYRVYGKHARRGSSLTLQGLDAGDAWWDGRTGVRIDWEPSSRDAVTALADSSRSRFDEVALLPTALAPFVEENSYRYGASTEDFLVRWRRSHRGGSETQFQLYFDGYDRRHPIYGEHRHTTDFEFQNRSGFAQRHELTWGGGYRFSSDQAGASLWKVTRSPTAQLSLYSAFVQDEIRFGENQALLTVGTKLQRNDYTGFDVQPTVRILFEPVHKHVFWSAVSRAVRTPSRLDREAEVWFATLPGSPQTGGLAQRLFIQGSPDNGSQPVIAWEAGYRSQPARRVSVDVALFRNDYHRLRSLAFGQPAIAMENPPYLSVPLTFGSALRGTTWGAEALAQFEVNARWRLVGIYNRLDGLLSVRPGAPPSTTTAETGFQPRHSGSLRSQLDLPGRLEFDAGWYAVGAMKTLSNTPSPFLYVNPSRWSRLDLRLAWPVRKDLELSLRMNNALDPRHPEFVPEAFNRAAQVRRGVDVRLEWLF